VVEAPHMAPEQHELSSRKKAINQIIYDVETENANLPWNEQLPVSDRRIETKRRLINQFGELIIEQFRVGEGTDPELDDAIKHVSKLLDKYELVDESTQTKQEVTSALDDLALKEQSEIAQRMIADFKNKNHTETTDA
jgi:hypothetical protein